MPQYRNQTSIIPTIDYQSHEIEVNTVAIKIWPRGNWTTKGFSYGNECGQVGGSWLSDRLLA
jgi:hypothetical protein